MTVCGTLLEFLKADWALSAPLGTANIYWSEEWFNSRKIEYPQITVTPISSPIAERFSHAGTLRTFRHHDTYAVNLWHKVKRGGPGTAEVDKIEDMRREVARVFADGHRTNWGGSLSPLRICLPIDDGVPRHELETEPRILRYELTLVATRDI